MLHSVPISEDFLFHAALTTLLSYYHSIFIFFLTFLHFCLGEDSRKSQHGFSQNACLHLSTNKPVNALRAFSSTHGTAAGMPPELLTLSACRLPTGRGWRPGGQGKSCLPWSGTDCYCQGPQRADLKSRPGTQTISFSNSRKRLTQ